MIYKTGGKLCLLGIPTVADRVVQASFKLVLEPIFEADSCRVSPHASPRTRLPHAPNAWRIPSSRAGASVLANVVVKWPLVSRYTITLPMTDGQRSSSQ